LPGGRTWRNVITPAKSKVAETLDDFRGAFAYNLLDDNAIGGIVLLTADVHYTSAHHYDPARAAIGDFTPFWEFVSGPLNAGAFGPNALDTTFGPQTVFSAAPPAANTSPADGFQFFGHVAIDGHSEPTQHVWRRQRSARCLPCRP
jgi:phosphodiesterase/alkaline phosphatase D-like protein